MCFTTFYMDIKKEEKLKAVINDALSEVIDPEIHVDIVTLGLIYELKISDEYDVHVLMTLTFPGCPYGPAIIDEVDEKVREIVGVRNVTVELTFEPAWSPDRIDPDIRAALGL